MTNGFGSGGFGSRSEDNADESGFGGWGSAADSKNADASGSGFGGGSFGQPANTFGDSSSSYAGGFGAGFGGSGSDGFSASTFDTPVGADGGGAGGVSVPVLKFGTGSWLWVSIATGSAVAGLLLGIAAYVTGSSAGSFTSIPFTAMAVAGWIIGGIMTFIFLGMHTVEDTKRRANGAYIENSTQVLLYRASASIGLIAIVVTAIEIALVFAK